MLNSRLLTHQGWGGKYFFFQLTFLVLYPHHQFLFVLRLDHFGFVFHHHYYQELHLILTELWSVAQHP